MRLSRRLLIIVTMGVTAFSTAHAATFVQKVESGNVLATSTSVTFPAPVTAGDELFVDALIVHDSSGTEKPIVTDSLGSTWKNIGIYSACGSDCPAYSLFYAENISSTATDTVTIISTSTYAYVNAAAFEYSGLATSTSLDTYAVDTNASLPSHSSTSTPSITTTNADDLILAGTANNCNAYNVTTTLPYVRRSTSVGCDQLADQSVAATGTYSGATFAFQSGQTSGFLLFTAAFRSISAPPATLSVTASSSLTYAELENGSSSTQDAVIENAGPSGSSLDWTATSSQSWLTLSTASGTLASSATTTLGITADPAGLGVGTYNGTVTVSASGATNSPQTISATLTVSVNPNLTACGVLDSASTTYTLQNDVTATGTCFSVQGGNITLNLNGHTVTYGNAPLLTLPNGGFESGNGTTTPDWDLSQAPNASIIQGTFVNPVQVKSGSSSLEFSLPFTGTTTETIVNTSSVTMPADHTYLAEAWYIDGNTASDTILLENASSGAILASSTANGPTSRGFTPVYVAYTPTSTQNVTIAVQISGASTTVETGQIYVDNVGFYQGPTYGVMAAGASAPVGYGITLASDTDLMYGTTTSNNFIVENGTFAQGTGDGVDSGAVKFFQNGGVNLTVTNVTSTMYGPDAINIEIPYQSGAVINGNHLYSSSTLVTDRDQQLGDGIQLTGSGGNNTISNNVIVGGAQDGIGIKQSSSSPASFVYGNDISQDAYYTNDFSIDAPGNVEVYDNTIHPTSGRGVIVDGGSGVGANTVVHNDTITTTELPQNQEYNGCQGGSWQGTYAVQVDNNPASSTVYDNTVVAQADQCAASALRITDSETAANVSHDNSYTAQRVGAGTGYAYAASIDSPTGFTSRNDTFSGDSADIFVDYDGGSGLMFYSPTFDKGANATSTWVTFGFRQGTNTHGASDIHYIDPTFGPGAYATSTDMQSSTAGMPAEYFIDYTNTLTVQSSSSSPLANVNVSIANASGTVVATGTTASNGTLTSVLNDLHVYNTTSSVVFADANPYTITLSSSGCTDATSSLTIATTTNETLTYCASTSTVPSVSSFSASPSLIKLGATSTLSWTTSGANTVSIDQGIGNESATSSGSVVVTPTSTLTYTLTAVNGNGTTTAATAVTVDTASPTVPTNLAATAASASEIDLSWTASTDDTSVSYYLVYRGASSSTLAEIATTTATTYDDTGLTASTAYYYAVAAEDPVGNVSTESSSTSATTSASGGGVTVIVAAGGGGGRGGYIPTTPATSTATSTPTASSTAATASSKASSLPPSTIATLTTTLNALEAQLLTLIKEAAQRGISVPNIPASIMPTPATAYAFTRDLQLHDRGNDVKALQSFLIKAASGPAVSALSAAGPTGYFGPLTFRALKEYQVDHDIPHTGYFGPITRGKIGAGE